MATAEEQKLATNLANIIMTLSDKHLLSANTYEETRNDMALVIIKNKEISGIITNLIKKYNHQPAQKPIARSLYGLLVNENVEYIKSMTVYCNEPLFKLLNTASSDGDSLNKDFAFKTFLKYLDRTKESVKKGSKVKDLDNYIDSLNQPSVSKVLFQYDEICRKTEQEFDTEKMVELKSKKTAYQKLIDIIGFTAFNEHQKHDAVNNAAELASKYDSTILNEIIEHSLSLVPQSNTFIIGHVKAFNCNEVAEAIAMHKTDGTNLDALIKAFNHMAFLDVHGQRDYEINLAMIIMHAKNIDYLNEFLKNILYSKNPYDLIDSKEGKII